MASIESLLNPLPDSERFSLPSPSLNSSTSTIASRTPRQKRQRLAKDAPVFNKGKIRGELRYPPCEERDEELTQKHREFQIHPVGDIAEYPRHIPYNSDKKSFQEQTGRESFEVFQYTFKIPGSDRQWTMMWDYNIGLVRTTHLFKCNDYSKTTPAKMLNANPGLREICHSITGGALAAQGYWMPFDAAKAVAATFCYKIRHALTPLFGLDFPSMCIHPQDRGRFGRMVIDPAIVKKATETAHFYRMLELRSPIYATSMHAKYRPNSAGNLHLGFGKPSIPKSHLYQHQHRYTDSIVSYRSLPDYTTATTTSEPYRMAPIDSFRNQFTPVNTPRSSVAPCSRIPSPRPRQRLLSIPRLVEKAIPVSEEDSGSDETGSSTMGSGYTSTPTECLSVDEDEDYRERSAELSCPSDPNEVETRAKRKHSSALFAREVKAAHALLSLHMQEALGSDVDDTADDETFVLGGGRGRKRRRASA